MKTLTVKSNGWYWEFKENEIRYIGKPKYSENFKGKKIGKITCYGPEGFKPSAKANIVYQKQIYRNSSWVNA